MTPGPDELWFVPLGGTGEIGMNLNLYGHDGAWLMVDLGVTFARDDDPPPRVRMADPGFISERRGQLAGLVVTHAHEDHVGAVAYLWRELGCPVWTTRFTAAVLERKLAEHGLLGQVPIHLVSTGERRRIGPFEVEWVGLTHSIPEPHALMLRTPAGAVFHTADWKLDADPVLGDGFAAERYLALGEEGVDVMVCDSTNATVSDPPRTEGELYQGLLDVVGGVDGRVVVTCFGSNVARLHTIARVAEATGRQLGVLGRSLENIVAAAREARIWRAGSLVPGAEIGYLPRRHTLVVATGSQGEPRAALGRLASGRHPFVALEAGDAVVFSSRVIPGNEESVAALVERFEARGVQVVFDGPAHLHASGHPTPAELRQMYAWVRPRLVVPVHGQAEHLDANAAIAEAVCQARTLIGRNGDLFMFAPHPGIRRGAVPVGRLGWNGRRLLRLSA